MHIWYIYVYLCATRAASWPTYELSLWQLQGSSLRGSAIQLFQHIQLSAQQFINSGLSLLTACVSVCVCEVHCVYFEVFYVQLK